MRYTMFLIMVLFTTNLYAKKYEIVDEISIGKDFVPIDFDQYDRKGVRLKKLLPRRY